MTLDDFVEQMAALLRANGVPHQEWAGALYAWCRVRWETIRAAPAGADVWYELFAGPGGFLSWERSRRRWEALQRERRLAPVRGVSVN